jgi:hypothetical protein
VVDCRSSWSFDSGKILWLKPITQSKWVHKISINLLWWFYIILLFTLFTFIYIYIIYDYFTFYILHDDFIWWLILQPQSVRTWRLTLIN